MTFILRTKSSLKLKSHAIFQAVLCDLFLDSLSWRYDEGVCLDGSDVVPAVAQHPRQTGPPHLRQPGGRQRPGVPVAVVEESVAC